MCSSGSHAGCNSHLYNAICSYLHNENRAQPIIGLNRITEMWTNNQPAVYFCDVCFLRIIKTDIRNHIMGSLHRYNYIKSHHAHGWRSYADLTLLARPLMDLAKIVEKKEGTGDVEVLWVDEVIYKELISWPVPAAFGKLKRIKIQQDPNALQSVVCNLVKGHETDVKELQEFESGDDITSEYVDSTQHVSNCSTISELLSQPSNQRQTPSPPTTSTPIRPILPSKEGCTPQSRMDSRISSIVSNLETSLTLALSQHINQDQAVIQDRYQIQQRCIMSSETPCLTETRSLHMPRTISVVRPPEYWSPIRIPCQNEEGNEVNHPFGVSYESRSVHLAQTSDAAHLQTSSFTVSHIVSESVTNREESFSEESLTESPEPVSGEEPVRFIKPIITQRRTRQSLSHDFLYVYDVADSQEPISTDYEGHAEFQSLASVEGKIPLPLQNSATPIQNPPGQNHSFVDCPETYTGEKPLIGLQAVIKCQSVDGNPPPCCYLCQLCSLKLKRKYIFCHLTGCEHQQNYIKFLHPQLLSKTKHEHCIINEMLEGVAMQLEREDGRGQIKVMRLSACLISEVLKRDYHWCMKLLNCGASVESFNKKTDKTTGPSQDLKRPAVPLSTHQTSKKMKKVHPTDVTSTTIVKNPVFKVSLSLQEGPIVIERNPLRVTATVAPEIENQSSFGINRQSDVQTCVHGCTLPLHNPEEVWSTQRFPVGNMIRQANVPTLTYTHTDVLSEDECMFENDVISPAQYTYEEQFDHSQSIQVIEPSLRHEDSVTYDDDDWPMQDCFFNNNDWILQRQMTGENDFLDYTRYMPD